MILDKKAQRTEETCDTCQNIQKKNEKKHWKRQNIEKKQKIKTSEILFQRKSKIEK